MDRSWEFTFQGGFCGQRPCFDRLVWHLCWNQPGGRWWFVQPSTVLQWNHACIHQMVLVQGMGPSIQRVCMSKKLTTSLYSIIFRIFKLNLRNFCHYYHTCARMQEDEIFQNGSIVSLFHLLTFQAWNSFLVIKLS